MTQMKRRAVFGYLLLVTCLLALTYYVSTSDVLKGQNKDCQKQYVHDVKVIVTTFNWSREYTSEKTSNITVADLLFECLSFWNITADTTYWSGYDSFFIAGIGNYSNGKDNRFWQYYVNDRYADVGCSKYVLNDNDEVLWVFEESKWS
ncbi:MAG: DUF4430 domain-containing protein [Thermoplasmatota archaeon]